MVNPLLQHAIAAEGYLTPTPIQQESIPSLLEGRDLLGCAQTGTGKTAAFLLPVLHRLALDGRRAQPNRPRALVLAPTRELAAQIAASAGCYARFIGTTYAVVFGGVGQFPQVKALNRGADLVVATPGRLLDLMEQNHLALDSIEEFVLDEADRMLDMGFLPDIKRILAKLPPRQHSMFFSATLPPEVMRLATAMVENPVRVTISPDKPTVETINQSVMFVEKGDKPALLISLLRDRPEMTRVIVFSRTRRGADKIVKKLRGEDIRANAIHSDKTQRVRTTTLKAFRDGQSRVLVATDIAARGIDVDNITHVINHDLPMETESYVHRIGRTARAGCNGVAISLVATEECDMLRAVEKLIRKPIPVDRTHRFHSEQAERSAGSTPSPAPRRKVAGKASGRRVPKRFTSHQGRNQPDFRKRRLSEKNP